MIKYWSVADSAVCVTVDQDVIDIGIIDDGSSTPLSVSECRALVRVLGEAIEMAEGGDE